MGKIGFQLFEIPLLKMNDPSSTTIPISSIFAKNTSIKVEIVGLVRLDKAGDSMK